MSARDLPCTCPVSFDPCPVHDPAGHTAHFGALSDIVSDRGSKDTNPKDAVGIRKAALSNVPMNVLVQVGLGMMEGGVKYGRYNFRESGVRASVYFDASLRHKLAWWEGQNIDPDSALHHVIKEICSLFVLADAILTGTLVDDRPPSAGIDFAEANRLAGEIIDRHKDKNPRHYTIADTKPGAATSAGE